MVPIDRGQTRHSCAAARIRRERFLSFNAGRTRNPLRESRGRDIPEEKEEEKEEEEEGEEEQERAKCQVSVQKKKELPREKLLLLCKHLIS